MFNIKEFVLTNLINGVNKGIFAKEYASTLATNYLLKGILTVDDVQRFDEETTVVDATDNDVATIEENEESEEE